MVSLSKTYIKKYEFHELLRTIKFNLFLIVFLREASFIGTIFFSQ